MRDIIYITVRRGVPADILPRNRAGFSLVEMLVVISIISMLVVMLMPAIQAARESSRRVTCQNNLRQFGIGLSAHAAWHGVFCSGAFDWRCDGCIMEKGWVADLVSAGIPWATCFALPAKRASARRSTIC